jgi:hypoxia up-regulated 1
VGFIVADYAFFSKLTMDRLAAFDASDKARRAFEEAFNSLEAFTYRARDYLEDESFIRASTSTACSTLEEKLSTVSDWLYSEGAHADEKTVRSKLKELEDIVKPVLNRKAEASKRPEALKELKETIAHIKEVEQLVDSQIKTQIAESSKSSEAVAQASASPSTDPMDELDDENTPAAPEITEVPTIYTETDLKAVQDTAAKAQAWLDENEAKQSKLGETDDPAFTVKDVQAEKKKIDDVVMDMMMKKMKHFKPPNQQKPKTAKPKKAANKDKAGSKKSEKANKGPSDEELQEALKKAGIKGDGAKVKGGDKGSILKQLEIPEDATQEEILAALDKAIEKNKEKNKEKDEL